MGRVGELALFLFGPGRPGAPLVNTCVPLVTITAPLRVCWDGGGRRGRLGSKVIGSGEGKARVVAGE